MGRKKRNKVRVAFRKNRGKRTRRQNVTHDSLDNDRVAEDQESSERLSGKGELSRRRTVITSEGDDNEIMIDVDESNCLTGRVVSFIGLNCAVQADDGRIFECTIRRVVRTMARDDRNAVVTGDVVLFRPGGDDDQGVIERVEPRRSELSRGHQRRAHVIAANIDQVLIVVSADDPPLKTNLVDRYLISSEKGGVDSVICINKVDLVDPTRLQSIAGMYGQLGYDVVLTSTVDGTGLDRLRELLRDHETAVSGQSGVGKSSLLNRIDRGLNLQTSEVSDWNGKGRHTTRRAILLPLQCGGWVVDTPGIRQFGLWDVIAEEIEGFFVEFRPFVANCHYPDCTHTHENRCAVKTAVETELISARRYDSYVRMLVEDDDRSTKHRMPC